MSYIKPHGRYIEVNGKEYHLLFTLGVIDELQDRTQMSATDIIASLADKETMEVTVKVLLRYLIGEPIEVEPDKLEYYSLVLRATYMEQYNPKNIEIKMPARTVEVDKHERIDTEYWFYIGKVVLGYSEEETLNMTLGKLITLRNEHFLFTGRFEEDKEVSVDEAIPI